MHQYTVVVAVANPATVAKLIHTSALIAEEHDGRLLATSVVPSPDEGPGKPAHLEDAFGSAQNLVERAEHAAQAHGLTCESRVAVAQHIHEAIASVAEGADADLLVIGMSEGAHPTLAQSDIDFDRIVDAVAAHAPCNVLVAKFRNGLHFDRVLVPVESATDLSLTRQIIVPLYHQAGADVDFVHFAPTAAETEKALEQVNGWLNEASLDDCGSALVKVAPSPTAGIVHASDAYDVVVLGTPPLHMLKRQLLGSLAEQVVQEAHCTTLVLRSAGGPGSLFSGHPRPPRFCCQQEQDS